VTVPQIPVQPLEERSHAGDERPPGALLVVVEPTGVGVRVGIADGRAGVDAHEAIIRGR
jgi:hypothetical protein